MNEALLLANNLEETVDFNYKIAHFFDWNIDAPLYTSLIVMIVLIVLGVIIGIKATYGLKKKKYLQEPKGFMLLVEIYYEFIDKFTKDKMGPTKDAWAGYFFTLFAYLFLAFNISLFGIPSVIDWLAAPLSLSIVMFTMIQVTALRYQHLHYFHRYVEPFAIFLPVNLITMWSPIISTSMRLFGNCLAGSIIIGLVQWALGGATDAIFNLFGLADMAYANYWPSWDVSHNYAWTSIWLSPIFAGVLNLYFSLFSSAIQTLVFASLSALWIAQEMPSEEEVEQAKQLELRTEIG